MTTIDEASNATLVALIRAQRTRILQLVNCNAMLIAECIFWRANAQFTCFHTRALSCADLPRADRFLRFIDEDTELYTKHGVTLD